jgi:hypothetical protein
MQFYNKWREFLAEAPKDAKVLRNINIGYLRKEIPQKTDEDRREYEARLQTMEADPDTWNSVFPNELVSWVEVLSDNHFPRDGRKRFAKWLGNAIWHEEAEERRSAVEFGDLSMYENDIRYIVDYLNGSMEFPKDLWDLSFPQMFQLSEDYHHRLAAGAIGLDDLPSGKLNYVGQKVVFHFKNGYSVAAVTATGEREYTKEEGLRCGWAHTEDEKQEFIEYYEEKGKEPPYFKIVDKINDLDIEGCEMGHCVGGYCDPVSQGQMKIYSLRDPANEPHATIEVIPPGPAGEYREQDLVAYSDTKRTKGRVGQIKGKGNAPPNEKYRPMIKQWLANTDLEYEQNVDFLNILSVEEIKDRMTKNQLSPETIVHLMESASDPEMINLLFQIIEETESIENQRKYILRLTRNRNLNEDQIIRLLKINLPIEQTGAGVFNLLTAPGIDQQRIVSRLWEELKSELTSVVFGGGKIGDEELYYLAAILKVSNDTARNDEIVNHILSDEYTEMMRGRRHATTMNTSLRRIIQTYTERNNLTQNPDILRKIYHLSKTSDNHISVHGAHRYVANAHGIDDSLADEMIQDIKLKNPFVTSSDYYAMALLKNRRVGDSKKIELSKIFFFSDDKMQPTKGLKYSVYAKSQARELVTDAASVYSARFLKWLTHSGLLDAYFVNRWKGKQVRKTGREPREEDLADAEKDRVLSQVHKLRDNWMRIQLAFIKKDFGPAPWVRESVNETNKHGEPEDEVMNEINKYFNKKDKRNPFYKEVERSLVKEEAGRSRQRGIYKFHCMLSYGLTSGEGKTRGLDDILADMRALENVTIVTVAIRNQKVSPGRYIAGLAIKFIPSVPGQFNSPEDVKARIVRDVKRLTNVQTLFKLSAGLNRLE